MCLFHFFYLIKKRKLKLKLKLFIKFVYFKVYLTKTLKTFVWVCVNKKNENFKYPLNENIFKAIQLTLETKIV